MSSRKVATNQTSIPRRRSRNRSRQPSRPFSTTAVGNGASGGSSRRGTRNNNNSSTTNNKKTVSFGECCGGTTAECAAICCCCPLAIANLVVLAVYKIPAGLCRRAIHRKRRLKLLKKGMLQPCGHGGCGGDSDFQIHNVEAVEDLLRFVEAHEGTDKDVKELENEMWQRFYNTGFGRSASQIKGESIPKFKPL